VGPDGDEARPVVGIACRLDRRLDGRDVVAVGDPLGVPTVGIEALRHVLGKGHGGRAIELDVVVVVQDDQLAQAQVAGKAGRLRGDALLEVAIAGDHVRPVIDDRAAGAIELRPEPALGDGHADRVREALAEGAGGRLDARCQARFRMPRSPRAPLAEQRELLEWQVVAGQVQQRVEQHRGVPGGQHEPVPIRPFGMRRRVAEEARPEHVRHRCRAHRGAWVPGICLLDGVHREGSDRVDREAVEVGRHGSGHRSGSGWAAGGRPL
jgi:hypothetical protein